MHAHALLYHCYADDTQLYFFCKPSDAAALKDRIIKCIGDVAEWMASNCLKLNPAKSEFLWCATARRLHLIDDSPFQLADGDVTSIDSARNLGAYFDASMNMTTHVRRIISSSFYQLRHIRAIRKSIPTWTAVQLVNSFVVLTVDYCNSLMAGLPASQLERVQSVLNCAAQLIYGRRKNDHVTPLLRDKLHWLHVRERVQYKCCLLVFKALNGLAQSYIADFCVYVATLPGRSSLRSAAHLQLVLPQRSTKFEDRSFSVAGPTAWNRLPENIKLSPSVDVFKAQLTTFLFAKSYEHK